MTKNISFFKTTWHSHKCGNVLVCGNGASVVLLPLLFIVTLLVSMEFKNCCIFPAPMDVSDVFLHVQERVARVLI